MNDHAALRIAMEETLNVTRERLGSSKLILSVANVYKSLSRFKAAAFLYAIETDSIPFSQRSIHIDINNELDFEKYASVLDKFVFPAHCTLLCKDVGHAKAIYCSQKTCASYSICLYLRTKAVDSDFYSDNLTTFPNLRSLSLIDERCLFWFQKAFRLEELHFANVVSYNMHDTFLDAFTNLKRVYVTRPPDTFHETTSQHRIFLRLAALPSLEQLVFINTNVVGNEFPNHRPSPKLRTLVVSHPTMPSMKGFLDYIADIPNVRFENDTYYTDTFEPLRLPRDSDFSKTRIQNLVFERPTLPLAPCSMLWSIRSFRPPSTLKSLSVYLEYGYVTPEWIERVKGVPCLRVTSYAWTEDLLRLVAEAEVGVLELVDEAGDIRWNVDFKSKHYVFKR